MAIDINKDISYQLSINVLKALGGDTSKDFQSVEEVWDEINKIYDNAGDRLDIEALIMDIRNNGLYEFYPNENADAYAPVRVNVNIPQKYTDEYVEQLGRESFNQGMIEGEEIGYQKGFEEGSDDGYQDGYSEGLDDGAEEQKSLMVEATIRGNGVYEREDGYRKVTVDVTIPTFETEQLSVELTENGDYNYTPSKDGYDSVSVSVNVPIPEPADLRILDIEVTSNKSYKYTPTDYDGWNKVNLLVNVPTGGDSGKPKIYNGFQFTGGDIAQVDFSQYDWSNVYDTSYFFQNCTHSTGDWSNFLDNYNGKILIAYSMFNDCSNLTTIPQLDTSKVTDMRYMFQYCSNLTTIPQLDTSNVTDMGAMFDGCSNLTTIPLLDTSKVTDMGAMFWHCLELTSIPQLDTSNVTDMSTMFNYCFELTSIPQLDTSNVTDMSRMFSDCSKLTTVPQLDTSKVTNMSYMFYSCKALSSIPQLDTSKVTDMSYMFYYCSKLTSIPQLDTSKVTNMSDMLYGCSKLTTVPKLYCGKISSGSYIDIFYNNTMSNVTDLGGFEDLGKVSGFSKPSYFLKNCPNLTKESVMNVINNLYDRKTARYSVVTLPFNTKSLALLSDEEKAIATNKGWTLATS